MKRILVMSDTHCGHLVGLTPPQWQAEPTSSASRTKRTKFVTVQKEAWAWYKKNVRAGGPYDLVVMNGDAIDGPGFRSGGTELITTDRQEQVEMACSAIKTAMVGSPKLVMTYGTGYHTGDQEDWENDIAKDLNALKIGSHEWVDVEGVVFDLRHHIGSSSVPHGRSTALNRAALWANLWADQDYTPKSNVLIRSHVHYFSAGMGDTQPELRVTTPALQAMGSKYGARRCEGLVSFGFLIFEVHRGKITRFEPVRAKLQTQKTSAIKI